jgi:hypothetical protein
MNDSYIFALLVWVLVGLVATLRTRDPAQRGVGLTLTFIIAMAMNHWFGALVCFLPWYSPSGSENVAVGFELAKLGIFGFAVGCFAIAPFISPDPWIDPDEELAVEPSHPRVLRTYTLVGIGSYFGMALGLTRIPSLAAMVAGGFSFLLAAICLAMWCAQQRGEHTRQHLLLASAFSLPLFTMVTRGFLGFGVGYLIVVFSFYLLLSQHRIKLLVICLPLAFLAMSFFVTYMRDRGEIRRSVWGGQAYGSRFEQLWQTVSTIEWFDPLNIKHLERVDLRLNQNRLIGLAALHLESTKGYAHGETVWMALFALVPRVLWADKPQYAGGNGLVSEYTGLKFDQDTSVGMGPIFELEINFGRIGVFLGMVLIGVIVGVADRKAGASLRLDDPLSFGKWFLVGITMQNANGSFAETTAGLAATLLFVSAVNHYLRAHPDVESYEPADEHPVDSVNL